jgi:hypothetical protein
MQNGTLFTEDFLGQGVQQTPDWEAFNDDALKIAEGALKKIFAPFEAGAGHNEADTEERIIYKVLTALGWDGLILRRNTMAVKGREDIPDGLLLPDNSALVLADKAKKPSEKFRHGIVICESKKWELGLDSGQGDQVP